jgi:hypothetical protein
MGHGHPFGRGGRQSLLPKRRREYNLGARRPVACRLWTRFWPLNGDAEEARAMAYKYVSRQESIDFCSAVVIPERWQVADPR